MKSNGGFTLLELIVVCAMISILLSISTFEFRSFIEKTAMEKQTRAIYNDIMMTRARALYSRTAKRVVFTTSTFKIYSSSASGSGINPVTNTTLKYPVVFSGSGTVDFDEQGFFNVVTNGNMTVCIEPSGNNSPVDSVVLFSTRARIGKRSGGTCASTQITVE